MSTRRWIGLIVLVIGVGFLLQAVGVWDFGTVAATYWPLLLVLIGIVEGANRSISWIWAFVLVAIGAYLQLERLSIITVSFGAIFWPVLLILVGAWFAFGHGASHGGTVLSGKKAELFSLFGGTETVFHSESFEGGSVTALFGGSTLDLREVQIAPPGAQMDLTAIFGGVDVFVPESWKVIASGLPIFGGWENKTKLRNVEDAQAPVFRARCLALFGGVEIKN